MTKENKKTVQKIFSYSYKILLIVLVCFCIVFTTAFLSNKISGVPTSFFGTFNLKVGSSSMVKSGLNVGDYIIARTCDTNTLKKDDIIAFYNLDAQVDKSTLTEVNDNTKIHFTLSASEFFGFASKEIRSAAKQKRLLVLHHIRAVYQDESGKRYFTTYGSSNFSDDSWIISQDYVLGAVSLSKSAKNTAKFLSMLTADVFLYIIVFCLILLIFSPLIKKVIRLYITESLKEALSSGKKTPTDPKCLKYQIGFSLDEQTKEKILTNTPQEDREDVARALWKEVPQNIKQTYLTSFEQEQNND